MTTPATCFWGTSSMDEAVRTVGSLATQGFTEVTWPRGGVGTETVAAVQARFLADPTRRHWNQVIWIAGRIAAGETATTIKAGIAAIVAALSHENYVVMGDLPDGNQAAEQGPAGATYLSILALNNDLRTLYGDHYYDPLEFLMYRGQAAAEARSIANLVASATDQPSDISLIAAANNALMADVRRHMRSIGLLTKLVKSVQIQFTGGIQVKSSNPAITSSASGNVDEGRPYSIQLTSSTPNVLWEIRPGLDGALFSLVAPSGPTTDFSRSVLRMGGKDFESPSDANANNVYQCIIRCSDGLGHFSEQTHSVTVGNTDDATAFTETTDYTARMTTAPDSTIAGYVDSFTRELVAANLMSKISQLSLACMHDGQSGTLNLKGATGTLVNQGALQVPGQGWLGNGTSTFLNGIALASLDNGINNANLGIGFISLTDMQSAGVDVGCSNSANIKINGRSTNGRLEVNALSATPMTALVPDSLGLYGFQCTGPRSRFAYAKGGIVAEQTGAAVQLPTGTLQFLASQGASFSTRLMGLAVVFKGASLEDWQAFDAIAARFLANMLAYVPLPIPAARFEFQFEGPNGSTDIVDIASGKEVFVEGNAELTGSNSLLLSAAGDFIYMDDHPDFQPPRKFWIRCEPEISNFQGGSHFSALCSKWDAATNNRSFQFLVHGDGSLRFYWSANGTSTSDIRSAPGLIVTGKRYWAAVERDDTDKIRLYLLNLTDNPNGVAAMVASGTFAGDFHDGGSTFRIGDTDATTNSFVGELANFVFQKDQIFAGTDAGYTPYPAPPPPDVEFKVRELLRYQGNQDLTAFQMKKELVLYDSSFQFDANDVPSLTHIRNTRMPALRQSHPNLTHLIIDIERWRLQDGGSIQGSGANAVFVPDAAWNTRLQHHINVINEFKITHRLAVTGGSGTFTDGETVTDGTRTGVYKAAQSTSSSFGVISANTPAFSGTLTGQTSGATRTITAGPYVGWIGLKLAYYGEIPVRSLLHLTGNQVERTAILRSRNNACAPLVAVVDFLCPSCYLIGVLSRNWLTSSEAQRASTLALAELYIEDMVAESRRIAPTKECWIVYWNEYHNLDVDNGWPTPEPARPQYLPGVYWRALLEIAFNSGTDKLAVWSRAAPGRTLDTTRDWWIELAVAPNGFIPTREITI